MTNQIRIAIYNIFMHLMLPFLITRLFYKSIKAPNYRKRFLERLGVFKDPNFTTNSIWVHSVSMGESIASFPIIKKLQQDNPNTPIVVTTTTPTGSAQVKQVLKDSVFHVYLPYDVSCALNSFIKKTKPKKLIIMETELWPNLLHAANKNNIKSYLVNARLSNKSTQGYLKIAGLSRYMMQCLEHISAQYQHDANNYIKLGANPNQVSVVGNVKFDISPPQEKIELGNNLKQQFKEKFVLCIASTHAGEEKIILDTYQQLLTKLPNLLLILVPRHPERFNEVASLIEEYSFNFVRRSKNETVTPETKILLGDTMGEMMLFFAASDLAFIGGSLLPTLGGHNMLEPASVNVPVITGRNLRNFKAISHAMQQAEALIVMESDNANELLERLKELITNDTLRSQLTNNGQKFLAQNKGAVAKICERISNS